MPISREEVPPLVGKIMPLEYYQINWAPRSITLAKTSDSTNLYINKRHYK